MTSEFVRSLNSVSIARFCDSRNSISRSYVRACKSLRALRNPKTPTTATDKMLQTNNITKSLD